MLRTLALVVLASLSASCVVHVRTEEEEGSTELAAMRRRIEALEARMSAPATGGDVVGVVVDAQGRPTVARIALVGRNGSVATSTDADGRFALELPGADEIVAHASTDDGRVAVAAARPGADEVRLVLAAGSTVAIDMASKENVRCAVFQGDLRIEDFTLRPNESTQVVVPPGRIRLWIYDGSRPDVERELTVAPGATERVRFDLGA